jgi:lysozyme
MTANRIRSCAAGAKTLGIDVSAHQGPINWGKVAQSGVRFAFIRGMEGMSVDREFAANWAGAKAAGLLRGVYVYFRARHDGGEQARALLQVLSGDTGELPPALDIETFDEQSPSTLVAHMRDWLSVVGSAVGRKPIVYSGSFWHWNVSSPIFSEHPLWTPDYTESGCPGVPKGWAGWKFWQYTSSGSVPGISSRVDMNVFNGSESELRSFASNFWPRAMKWGLALLLLGGGYYAWRRYGRKRLGR